MAQIGIMETLNLAGTIGSWLKLSAHGFKLALLTPSQSQAMAKNTSLTLLSITRSMMIFVRGAMMITSPHAILHLVQEVGEESISAHQSCLL